MKNKLFFKIHESMNYGAYFSWIANARETSHFILSCIFRNKIHFLMLWSTVNKILSHSRIVGSYSIKILFYNFLNHHLKKQNQGILKSWPRLLMVDCTIDNNLNFYADSRYYSKDFISLHAPSTCFSIIFIETIFYLKRDYKQLRIINGKYWSWDATLFK